MSLIQVAPSQAGNPLLKSLSQPLQQNVSIPWDYYVLGVGVGVLFVTVKFHLAKDGYLEGRVKAAPKGGGCLLCLYDCKNDAGQEGVEGINKLCFKYNMRLLLAWEFHECAKWLEGVRRARRDRLTRNVTIVTDDRSIAGVLAAGVKPLRKKDAETLLEDFRDIATLASTSPKSLASVPGIGPGKIEALRAVFTAPFVNREERPKTPTKRKLFTTPAPTVEVKKAKTAIIVEKKQVVVATTSKEAVEKMMQIKESLDVSEDEEDELPVPIVKK